MDDNELIPAAACEIIPEIKVKDHRLVTLGVFLAVLSAVLIVIAVNMRYGCERPIRSYFSAVENADGEKLISSLPECAAVSLDESAAKLGFDSAAKWYEDEMLTDTLKELEEDHGKGIGISYTVSDRRALSDDECGKLSEKLGSEFGSPSDVDKAYELDITYTIKGRSGSVSEDKTVTVCKIGGKWSFAGLPDIIL